MILKFLFSYNEKQKRVLTGLVVNDIKSEYDPDIQYPMVNEVEYKAQEGERVISNYGMQYHGIFLDGEKLLYFNINDYMLKIKLNASSNVSYSTPFSKDCMLEVLNQLNYFNLDLDFEFVDSGLSLSKKNEYKDIYDGWFRKVTDDSYCMINYPDFKDPMYVGKENDNYILTDNFENAFRIYKKEIRNLLITRGYIDSDMNKNEVSFSHYNLFTDSKSYIFGGLNSFMVTFDGDVLKITKDVRPTKEFRLLNDEKKSENIRNVFYEMKAAMYLKKRYFKVNDKYIIEEEKNTFRLTDNAAFASPLDLRVISYLKQAFFLYFEDPKFEELPEVSRYFVYEDLNTYILSSEILDLKSKSISVDEYEEFRNAFSEDTLRNYILIYRKKYINLKFDGPAKFTVNYLDSGFNATLFSLKEADILAKVLNLYLEKREITYIYDAINNYNISFENEFNTLKEGYDKFLSEVRKKRFKPNPQANLFSSNMASDKGALDYLTILYPKSVADSYILFKQMLPKMTSVNNILLCATSSTCELLGLSLALKEIDRNINVTTLEPQKWGFYPPCNITNKINYKGSIRMNLSSLPKSKISEFDLIYIGKHYNEEAEVIKDYLESLKDLDKRIILVHSFLSEIADIKDNYNQAINGLVKAIKLPFLPPLELFEGINCDKVLTEADFTKPIISRKITRYSVIRLKDKNYLSLLQKKE